jgi:C-terminal processing protease CtpA/Prc
MGNLGMGVWRHFHLIADYAHDRLYLTPYNNTREFSFDKDRSGLALRRLETGLEVVAVAESAPAARQGWAKGDRIETIDGMDATAPQLRCWDMAPQGTSFMLRGVDANGQAFSRKLTLIDFY